MTILRQLASLQSVRERQNDSAGAREHHCRVRLDEALAAQVAVLDEQEAFDHQMMLSADRLNARVRLGELPSEAVIWFETERSIGQRRFADRREQADQSVADAHRVYLAAQQARHRAEVQLEKVRAVANEAGQAQRRRNDRLQAMFQDEDNSQQAAANDQFANLRKRVNHV